MSEALHCLPLERRCLLAFRGPDAVRYLNGQLSQEVRNLQDSALPACVTDAKGRLQAFVHVFRGLDDAIWIEGPAELEEELEARLTRYLIADDVEVENLSAGWLLWHLPDLSEAAATASGVARKANRIGSDGYDLWLPAGETPEIVPMNLQEAEARRIAAGVPAWGAELVPGMLPPEAGLDRNAISYHKGCYIGQEVLSRMKTAGKLNRRLARLWVDPAVEAGDSAGAGAITSASPLPDPESGLRAALGFIHKSQFQEAEVEVRGVDEGAKGMARILGWV